MRACLRACVRACVRGFGDMLVRVCMCANQFVWVFGCDLKTKLLVWLCVHVGALACVSVYLLIVVKITEIHHRTPDRM